MPHNDTSTKDEAPLEVGNAADAGPTDALSPVRDAMDLDTDFSPASVVEIGDMSYGDGDALSDALGDDDDDNHLGNSAENKDDSPDAMDVDSDQGGARSVGSERLPAPRKQPHGWN